MIKLAIVEDIKEIGDTLSAMAKDYGFICNQVYYNAEDAITFLPKSPPDVVLMDIHLPKISGIQAIKILKQQIPETEFCIFSMFGDSNNIYESLKAGATGYILKESSPEKIFDALKTLHAGGSPMSPSIARKIIEEFKLNPISENVDLKSLSKRELQILKLLATGIYYKEIAKNLSISVGTVKQHLHKIYIKLDVKNRTEAINKYLDR